MKNKITIPCHRNYFPMQVAAMKKAYPQFISYVDRSRMFFSGIVQPSISMPAYQIRIEYRKDKMPRVRVIDPLLVEDRPHYYKEANCLCLYKPENFFWTATTLISEYIVSWATCWLYFYEVWKDTGVWYGPEANHDKNKPKKYT